MSADAGYSVHKIGCPYEHGGACTCQQTQTHPEDYCQKCGGRNCTWFVVSEIWNRVVRDNNEPEILCPVCFVQLAETTGIKPTSWELRPEQQTSTNASMEEIARGCVDELGKKAVTKDGWWPMEATPIVRNAISAARTALQAELEQAKERINELWNHAQEQSDQLDLNIDEFLRIETCPNASEEIRGICDRAVKKIKRLVPLIEENADLQRRLATAEKNLDKAERTLEDERERHAQLQARCFEGFPSASDGIFDALKESETALQDKTVAHKKRMDELWLMLYAAEADRDQWKERAEHADSALASERRHVQNQLEDIHDLERDLAEAEEQSPRWIPMTERKPTEEDADGFGNVAYMGKRSSWCGEWKVRGGTHFHPLPKLLHVAAPDQQEQKDEIEELAGKLACIEWNGRHTLRTCMDSGANRMREMAKAALAYARKEETQ